MAMTFFIAGDPAQGLIPGGAIIWGPGYATAEAAAVMMRLLTATQPVSLVLIEAVDFESWVRQLCAWPWVPLG
jgi:hypothetical protein